MRKIIMQNQFARLDFGNGRYVLVRLCFENFGDLNVNVDSSMTILTDVKPKPKSKSKKVSK